MSIADDIKQLPESLQVIAEQHWQSFVETGVELNELPREVADTLAKVWACSDFVMQTCVRFPELFLELAFSGDLLKSYADDHYKNSIVIDFKQGDEDSLSKHLRVFRRREMLRIVWRDIAGWAEFTETTHNLSLLAEAYIDTALSKLYQWQCETLGTPVNEDGVAQQLVVLGMGKLGAWELNVSSDIDLIFAFAEEGEVKGGPKSLMNSEFFSRLGKKIIQALDQQTADGFVFRVDMRLRPFGAGGPLAASFNSFENYYLVHGRSWERYAMVKVRVVGGDYEQGNTLLKMIKPFVYRRYLDYGAYESLRELKEMIKQEVQRKGMKNNVKLGAGGIREVEFIAQVFQLIRGGRDTDLQERRVLVVLNYLAQKNLLPEYVVNELKDAYEEYSFLTVFQKVVQFCGVDLGGFYLDIIKDRQYTTGKDSVARRSCQTAMYHILEAMSRWIAPILSFTADEIWITLPKPKGSEREASVFLSTWYEGLEGLNEDDQKGRTFWLQILAVKNAVNKRIEEERNAGKIKGALATEVSLFCDGELFDALVSLGDELRFVLITSGTKVLPLSAAEGVQASASELDGLLLEIHSSTHAKCDRCWHHSEDVGQHAAHPELCGRCIENIEGDGEKRAFA